jgi:hypothetical protein
VVIAFFGWLVVMGLIVSPVIVLLCWLPWKIATPDTALTQAAFGFWYFLVLLAVIAGMVYALYSMARRLSEPDDDPSDPLGPGGEPNAPDACSFGEPPPDDDEDDS